MPHWIMDDLSQSSLPDARLSKRLNKLAASLAASPEAGVPRACGKAGANGELVGRGEQKKAWAWRPSLDECRRATAPLGARGGHWFPSP